MPEKYPDLALKGKPPTPPILRSEFYGNHYYEITTLKEPKELFGQAERRIEISAECIRSREGLFDGS